MQKHQSSYHLYLEKIVSFKNSIYTIFSAPSTSRLSLTLDVFLPAGGKHTSQREDQVKQNHS